MDNNEDDNMFFDMNDHIIPSDDTNFYRSPFVSNEHLNHRFFTPESAHDAIVVINRQYAEGEDTIKRLNRDIVQTHRILDEAQEHGLHEDILEGQQLLRDFRARLKHNQERLGVLYSYRKDITRSTQRLPFL